MVTQEPDLLSKQWDVVVIGAGAAGLMTCLELPKNLNVLLLNRNTSLRSSSSWAQGGIAAVTRTEDSYSIHAQDTITAGRGLCDTDAVNLLVKEAPNCVKRLQELGMIFDQENGQLSTTLEAAHTYRRVLHVKDRTGRALIDVLKDRVNEQKNLLHRRGVRVTQIWVESNRCCGVQVLDGTNLYWIPARAVVMATGGGGHLFANTTNPIQAFGEGIALAWEAGASIQNLEFIQFHPTALKLEGAPCFLLSEALRGEGALLLDLEGNSPVAHLRGKDLAPRDQISRALVEKMAHQNCGHMLLSLKNIPQDLIDNRFPTILNRCKQLGIDPLQNPIPVAPAAHYWMGGISTNLQSQTTLPGLYAVGEVACTGIHGANRLASNSLMECLVFARQLSSIELTKQSRLTNQSRFLTTKHQAGQINSTKDLALLIKSIEDLRKLCWKEVGVSRSHKSMQSALQTINNDLKMTRKDYFIQAIKNQEKDECRSLNSEERRRVNLLLDLHHRQISSSLLTQACLFRTESRGGHYRTDAPASQVYWECHSIQKKNKSIGTKPTKK